MENRDQVNQSEERLLKVLGPLSNLANLIKRISKPGYPLSLSDVIHIGGDGENVKNNLSESILSEKISQICRAGSRFSKNCLCVSLYGDSDNVMRWAIEHGAVAVVTDHMIEGIPCIEVASPEQFYANVCAYFRSQSNVKITAVAGSIGKTTTKRMITSVYQEFFNTFNDPENENQMDCVGYICQHIPNGTQMQVQEVSEDTPGCMKFMSQMLKPEIVVITAVDKSHIEQFDSQEKIYDEVCAIIENMNSDGTVIIDSSDKEVMQHINGKRIITVSKDDISANFYAKNIRFGNEGLEFVIVDSINKKNFDVILHNVFAHHNVTSALYAFAAGVCSGEPYEKILKGLDSYRTLGIRQNVYDSETNVKLYVDCYNAVGKSVESAIITAGMIPVKGKRVAVIGDIEEAGSTSEQIHRDVIHTVAESPFEYLLTFGPKMKVAVESIEKVRTSLKIQTYTDKKSLINDLKEIVVSEDLVLFKASRKSALETIIEAIWPKSYKAQMRSYSMAKLKWRLKVIFS